MRRLREALARIKWEQWVLVFAVAVATVSTSIFAVRTSRQADQISRQADENRQRIQETRQLARENRRLAREGVLAKQALCAQRVVLDNQIRRTEAFLDANPQGIPGIPVALIQAGLDDARAQRKPLARLHC